MEDKNQTSTSTGSSTGDTKETLSTTPEVTSTTAEMSAGTTESTTTTTPSVTETVVATPVVTETAVETPVVAESVTVESSESTPVAAPAEVTEEVASDATAEAVVTPSVHTSVVKQYVIAFGVVLVMAAGVTYVLIQQGRIQSPAFVTKVVEMVRPAPAAAVVNGVTISMVDFNKNKAQIEQSASQGGADLTSDTVKTQIKTQALDVLINTEILRQAATKDGVTVTDDQIKARYDEIVKSLQGEDNLTAKMAELGITKEGLMKDISSEILIQTYLAKAVDTSSISISDEDIKAAYDQANTNPDSKLPPLDNVKSAIEAQLKQGKEQELINAFIQKLRDAAKIETNV